MKWLIIVLGIFSSVEAMAFCWNEAASAYGHDPRLLAAIAEQESHYRPDAIGPVSKNGGRAYGLMQIFSSELPELAKRGISKEDLLNDSCLNVHEGARILAQKIRIVGPTWKAVGAYYAGERGSMKEMEWYVKQVKTRYLVLLDKPLPQFGYTAGKYKPSAIANANEVITLRSPLVITNEP